MNEFVFLETVTYLHLENAYCILIEITLDKFRSVCLYFPIDMGRHPCSFNITCYLKI